jgi:phospholipid transport system substrate-binding protein
MPRMLLGKKTVNCLMLFLVCIIMIIGAPRTGKTEQPGPKQTIQTFNAALLDAMKRADELGYSGRYKLLEPIIKDRFALSFMGTQSIGRYWKTLPKEQQDHFLKTYIDWTIATYAGRFDGYSGERFEVVSESAPSQGTVTVISNLIESNNEVIAFHYLMRKVEDRWQVVDIKISGVSQLALTRAQFTDVIKTKSFDGLIAMLKEKTAGFTQPKKR